MHDSFRLFALFESMFRYMAVNFMRTEVQCIGVCSPWIFVQYISDEY